MAYINASEIGDFLFCERSWWLRKNKYFGKLGDQELQRKAQQFQQGIEYHRSYSSNVRAESSGNRISSKLVMAAVLIAVVLVLLFLSLGRAYGSTQKNQHRPRTTVTRPVAGANQNSTPGFVVAVLQLGVLVVVSLLGMSLLYWSRAQRCRRTWHMPAGHVISVDDERARVLLCKTLGLAGKPDAIRRDGPHYVPEERKKSRRPPGASPRPHHRMQLIAYCYLVDTCVGPVKKGILSYSNGQFEVEYTASAREELIATVRRIRALGPARSNVNRSHNFRARCASCAAVQICEQSLAQ